MSVDWELGLRNFKFCMISSHTMAYARRRALEKARKRHGTCRKNFATQNFASARVLTIFAQNAQMS